MKKDDDFWDAEFLYNVPSLFKGDFFGEELLSSDNLQCTYEINTAPECDVLTETTASEDEEDDEEEVIEEKSVDSLKKRSFFKCNGCRRTFCKSSTF